MQLFRTVGTWGWNGLRASILFASIALSLCTGVLAESLTWENCVIEAGQSNPELLSAGATIRSSEFQIDVARSGFFPQFSLDFNSSRSHGSAREGSQDTFGSDTDNGAFDSFSDEDRTTNSLSLVGTQNLFSGFQTTAEVEQARATRQVNLYALEISRAKVSRELKAAFANLLFSQKYLELTHSIIKRRMENLRLVELRYQSGNENKGSYLLSKAALSEAEFNRLQAQDLIRVARQELARVLGRDEAQDLIVSDALPLTDPPQSVDLSELVRLTPEDRQAMARVTLAQAELKAAKAPHFPSVDVSGQMGRSDGSDMEDQNRWLIGLQVSLPLFRGGRTYYGVKSASETLVAAQSNRTGVAQRVLVTLQQSFNDFVEAIEQVRVNQDFLEAASVRAEIARAKYNNGLISFEDWDIIENDLISRQKNLLQSERDRVVAEAAWEQAQGKGALS